MIGLLILVAVSLMFMKVRSNFIHLSVCTLLFVELGTVCYLGWGTLVPRLISIFTDNMSGRTEIFETTFKMIDDYGFFGSGPGTFEAVIQFELDKTLTTWASWVHSDYLEFYLTFGIIGMAILNALAVILALQFLTRFSVNST
jgi:O-antigen ligase